MNKNLTEIVFILDASGSMHGMEEDTIGGVNSFLEKQKLEEGDAVVSTVQFNTRSRVLHDRKSLKDIKPLTRGDYSTGGCTALLDAMGDAIHHIGNVHKYAREEDRPFRTVFVIMTDGLENASHRYSSNEVKEMVNKQKEKYGWEFLFLAANIDAIETAAHYGIDADHSVEYHSDGRGTRLNYECVSDAVSNVRKSRPVGASWKRSVEDYREEKRRK